MQTDGQGRQLPSIRFCRRERGNVHSQLAGVRIHCGAWRPGLINRSFSLSLGMSFPGLMRSCGSNAALTRRNCSSVVTGGALTKFGNGTLLLAGTNNNYAQTIINADTNNSASSVLASLTRTGTPFGTGPITVNPGSLLRIVTLPGLLLQKITTKEPDEPQLEIAIRALEEALKV